MNRTKLFSALLLSFVAVGLASSPDASAREGGWRSVGKGIKCINQAVLQPNGTFKVQQVCANRG
jgi:hypothetical protein